MLGVKMNRSNSRRSQVWALVVALLIAAPTALFAQGMTPEQVVSIEQVGDVAMSPDGARIAFTLSVPRGPDEDYGRSYTELWIVPAGGGAVRPIVESPHSAGSPQWSPDGSTLAFTARLDADEQTQVYGVPAAGGEPRLLTRSPLGMMAFAWSPDGKSIAYTAREPEPADAAERRQRGDDVQVASDPGRPVRLWVEDIETGQRSAVTPADLTVRSFEWMPSGLGFAVQMTKTTDIDASYMLRQIYVVRTDGSDLRQLTQTEGKLGDMEYSPDGQYLAFIGAVSMNDPLAQSIFVVPTTGGGPLNLTPDFNGSALEIAGVGDGYVYFVAAEGTRTTLNRIRAARGEIERLAGGGPEIFTGVSFDARRRNFAASVNTDEHPREVYTGEVRGGELQRVTKHNAWLDSVQLAGQETIEWAGADGWRIEGVLIHPLDEVPGVRYPLTILPHGGP
jgi:dipeptidyl aminopeptidase/acylaminoacyl peptidase